MILTLNFSCSDEYDVAMVRERQQEQLRASSEEARKVWSSYEREELHNDEQDYFVSDLSHSIARGVRSYGEKEFLNHRRKDRRHLSVSIGCGVVHLLPRAFGEGTPVFLDLSFHVCAHDLSLLLSITSRQLHPAYSHFSNFFFLPHPRSLPFFSLTHTHSLYLTTTHHSLTMD